MNRLWVRLSVAFSLIIIGGVILLGGLGSVISRDELLGERLLNLYQLPGGFLDRLASIYQAQDGWEGIEELLSQQDARLPRAPTGGLALMFANAEGRVIYDAYYGTEGDILSPEQRSDALEIKIDDRIVGYIRLNRTRDIPPSNFVLDPYIQEQVARIIVTTVGMVGLFSIVAGALLSRVLTAPLAQMSHLARSFASNGLTTRAPIRGTVEVRDVAAAFNEMADALQKAEAQRRNLVADIAHELRTPLTVLKSNLQALVDGVYDFTPDEAARLLRQTDLLTRLVNDLRDLSQAEARQLHLNIDVIDLPTFVTTRTQKFSTVAEAHGIKFEISVPPHPILIEGDPDRLEQVLNNLLNNAITHTPDEGSICVEASAHGAVASVSVRDSGAGISPQHLPRIFERLYRADPSRSRATGGAGLGLAIARAIVELHGGTISATSEGVPGKGATFTITLPLSEPAAEPADFSRQITST